MFPDDLKTGRITPIYKKDNAELLENYRPISTLPKFGKLFEKIIYRPPISLRPETQATKAPKKRRKSDEKATKKRPKSDQKETKKRPKRDRIVTK